MTKLELLEMIKNINDNEEITFLSFDGLKNDYFDERIVKVVNKKEYKNKEYLKDIEMFQKWINELNEEIKKDNRNTKAAKERNETRKRLIKDYEEKIENCKNKMM